MHLDDMSVELAPITWQLAAAFGQGAGTMLITTAAAQAVMDQYQQGLRTMESWDSIALQMIGFMRALGAASAMRSLRRGAAVIEVEDVQMAIARLEPNQPEPLGPCPICLT